MMITTMNSANHMTNSASGESNGNTNVTLDVSSANLLQSLLSNGLITPQPQLAQQDPMGDFVNPLMFQNADRSGVQTTLNIMFCGIPSAPTSCTPSNPAHSCAMSQWASSQSFAANAATLQGVAMPLPSSVSLVPQALPQQQAHQQETSMSWNNINASLDFGNGTFAPLHAMLMSQDRQQQRQQQRQPQDTDLFPTPIPTAVSDTDLESSTSAHASNTKTARFRRDQAEQWSERYDELLAFRKEHGHCRVPRNHKEYGALSAWVKRQRYQYKLRKERKQSFLTDERVEVLDRLGFVWDSHGSVWETRFQELQEFHEQFGHSNVPYNYGNAKLASWIKAQRREMRAFKDGKTISPEMFQRFLKLEKYGFCWQLRSSGRKSQSKQARATPQQQVF
jgi:hypothetical protein